MGSRWVSVPVSASPYYMPEADGIIKRANRTSGRADLVVFAKDEAAQKRLAARGVRCRPLVCFREWWSGSAAWRWFPRRAFQQIGAQLAGGRESAHSRAPIWKTRRPGEFNLPYLRKQFPGEEFSVVTFARWEEGLILAPGNPKGIHKIEDLARKNLKFVNREPGSGSRGLLDKLLEKAGMDAQKVQGYDRITFLDILRLRIACFLAGCRCLCLRRARQLKPLDSISFHCAVSDTSLVMRERTADLPAVKSFLDVLQRATLRRSFRGAGRVRHVGNRNAGRLTALISGSPSALKGLPAAGMLFFSERMKRYA